MNNAMTMLIRIGFVAVLLTAIWHLWPETVEPRVPTEVAFEPEPVEVIEADEHSVTIAPKLVEPPKGINWFFEQLFGSRADEEVEVVTGTLKGRLAWITDGTPISGAKLYLTRTRLDTVIPGEDEPRDWTGEHLLSTNATTDREGRFVLEEVPTHSDLFFIIRQGRHIAEVREVSRRPIAAGEVVDLDDILLESRGSVSGTIQTADGQAVEHAQIRIVDDFFFKQHSLKPDEVQARVANAEYYRGAIDWSGDLVSPWAVTRDRLLPFRTALTDSSGRFHAPGVRPGQNHILIHMVGHAPKRLEVVVESGRTTEAGVYSLDAEPEQVRVRVVDPLKQPVAGVEVLAVPYDKDTNWGAGTWMISAPPSRTGPDGWATCALIKSGTAIFYRVRRSRTSPWEPLRTRRRGSRQSKSDGLELILPPLQTRRVSLWNQRTRIGHKAKIVLEPSVPSHKIVYVRLGDVWEIQGLVPNVPTTLYVTAPGCSLVSADISVFDRKRRGRSQVQKVKLGSSFGFTAIVRNESGELVDGASLELRWPVERGRLPRRSYRDRWGEILSAGPYAYGRLPQIGLELLAKERLQTHLAGPFQLGRTNAKGELWVRDVWGRHLELHATSSSEAGSTNGFEASPGRKYTITIGPLPVLRGVISEDGRMAPIERWFVRADHLPASTPSSGYGSRTTLAGTDGRFEFTDLRAGDWWIRPVRPRLPGRQSSRFEEPLRADKDQCVSLHSGEERQFDLVIKPRRKEGSGRTIVGNLLLNGLPTQRLLVRGEVGDRPRGRIAAMGLDEFGSFALHNMPRSGSCQLTFGEIRGGRWIDLHSESHDLSTVGDEIRIDLKTSYVMLALFGPTGKPLAGRQVRFDRIGDRNQLTVVATDKGIVELNALPIGKYRLSIQGEDGLVLENPMIDSVAGGKIYEDRSCRRR